MNQITTLSDQPQQTAAVTLDNGDTVTLDLTFQAQIQRWTMTVTHKARILRNLMIVAHANMLRTWRNVIPFGIAVNAVNGVDPSRRDDFSSGRVSLSVLSTDEIQQIERDLLGAS